MAGEKKFPPTAAKLRKARARGDVAKSKDVTGTCVLGIGFGAVLSVGPYTKDPVFSFFRACFAPEGDFLSNNMLLSGCGLSWVLLLLIMPFLLFVFVVCLVIEIRQVGLQFRWEAAALRGSRINPVAGIKRWFEFHTVFEGLKSLGVWGGGFLCLWSLSAEARQLLCVLSRNTAADFEWTASAVMEFGIRVFARLLLLGFGIAAIDFLVQRARWKRTHSMTLEELKNELKESEGNPEVKMMRRHLQQELSAQGTIDAVRRAKVLVVGRQSAKKERAEAGR